MKKIIIIIPVIVASFLAGWTLMPPSLDFLSKIPSGIMHTRKGIIKNGPWMTRFDLARSDTPPLVRAYIVHIGIAANQAEEALYWNANTDKNGLLLNGNHSYNIRFQTRPPVRNTGFWSLTVYDKESYLVPNIEKQYAVGDRSRLVKHSDGSFIIKISQRRQNKIDNWLPSPHEGAFSLTLRMYIPDEEVLKHPEKIALPITYNIFRTFV